MKNLVVFASGNGSNFEAIAKACINNKIDAKVLLLVCDKKDAYAIKRAELLGIESFVVSPRDFPSKDDYEKAIVDKLSSYNIDLICLAGYMRIIGNELLSRYEGIIINTHPSLLPSFRGKDAIEQAMDFGVKVYGITIHYVDSSLDGGKIIAQKSFEYRGDDIEYLKKRLLKIEHKLYIDTINEIL
ncbi:MAG: phosphoribosylglycinamide formyltransferase [Muribaculaceae bacterium]|nr:phosphoribosylglycinamide formyltransferase [Muribaculaceae bacterium]